tara:strand:+ start:45722 stop:46942 length:1221 start_codon:yes stop_codon:yes gene_type:complete
LKKNTYDIAIVGGGIIGLSTALQITNTYPDLRLIVLEKEQDLGLHQSSRNSGVIHSGIYYRPDSMKAKTCVSGARKMIEFAQEHNINYEICGKVIVATNEIQIPRLEELYKRAKANGVKGIEMIAKEELLEKEPHAKGIKALWVPSTGIIDYPGVLKAYAKLFLEKDQEIKLNQNIKKIQIKKNQIFINSDHGEFSSSYLINCAGLYADRIASLAGAKLPVKIVPFRGEYYQIKPSRENLVNGLIYPVPDPAFPFLGVHFTKRIDGTVEAGPNAVLAFAREGYKKSNLNFKDLMETITYGGFLKLARKYWKVGMGEMYRSLSKKAFTKALQELLPEIQEDDLIDGGSGVRAQAIDRNGKLIDDFSIIHTERALHVCNAPSPGATSSIAIGETITSMLKESFPNLRR